MMFINLNGIIHSLEKPLIMAIINSTPDSFYDGSEDITISQLMEKVEDAVQEGADILDIGGMSSRPGAKIISVQEEIRRVIPLLEQVRQKYPSIPISIDTFRSEVVAACLPFKIDIVNDITGASIDERLLSTVAKYNLIYITMHMKGIPETMQNNPSYNNVIESILEYFVAQIKVLRKIGIKNYWIDPGFGFGKTVENNYEILRHLNSFSIFDVPILVGLSRKSMIYKPLHTTAQDCLPGTTVAHALSIMNGANVLRVHDVKEAKQAIEVLHLYRNMPNC